MVVAMATFSRRPARRIGYGAMQLAERPGRSLPDRGTALAVLRRALELGVDHIDTADFYGHGLANDLIRAALHLYPDHLLLVSKVGAERGRDGLVPAQQPLQLRAQVEANLRRLDVDRLAAVNLRRLDKGPGLVASGDQVVDLDDQLAEMVAMRDEGKIDGIGLSNVTLDQLRAAEPVGIVCVQNAYNLLERSDEPMLRECAARGIAWVPFFPLGSGFPGMPKVVDDEDVIAAAKRLEATPSQVGLAWLLAHDPNTLLIPGTASVEHLEENVAAADLDLTGDEILSR